MNIVFDIGGTKSRIGVSENGETIDESVTYKTPQKYEEGITTFTETVKNLAKEQSIDIIAGGIPGPLNKEKSMVINAPNLQDYNNKPFKEEIESNLNSKLFLENDTAMIGLGEALKGAGKEKDIVEYMTFSTGVGGCRIVNGKIAESAFGFEPGHQIINSITNETLEDLASGTHIEKKYGKPAKEITDEKIWEDITRCIAIGLNNVLVFWSPDIIVIGGAIATGKNLKIEHIRKHLKEITTIFPKLPSIELSSLSENAGLIGSLEYIKRQNL